MSVPVTPLMLDWILGRGHCIGIVQGTERRLCFSLSFSFQKKMRRSAGRILLGLVLGEHPQTDIESVHQKFSVVVFPTR